MKLIATPLVGLALIEQRIFRDDRGFFLESWNAAQFAEAGLDIAFIQDNHSRSAEGVVRGLHYQSPTPQGKLIRAVRGAIFDVAVDIRRSSPTFGQWFGTELSDENGRMLWVPAGFAHGFLSLTEDTDVTYKCDAPYAPASEHTILWNDPAIGIEWPLDGVTPRLSAKDAVGKLLSEAETFR